MNDGIDSITDEDAPFHSFFKKKKEIINKLVLWQNKKKRKSKNMNQKKLHQGEHDQGEGSESRQLRHHENNMIVEATSKL